MIEIRTENGEHRPYVVCDHCGRVIQCHGNMEWNPDEPATLYFTHKECSWAFNQQFKSRGIHLHWMELDNFLVFLRRNLHASHLYGPEETCGLAARVKVK